MVLWPKESCQIFKKICGINFELEQARGPNPYWLRTKKKRRRGSEAKSLSEC
jgi:hypothetical protein